MYVEPFPGRSSGCVHVLPVELLSYIFLLGTHYLEGSENDVDAELQDFPPFNTESVKAPLVFSSVCRHWRSVAFNTPALWTSICITVGSLEVLMTSSGRRGVVYHEPTLKTTHIEKYLALSRKYPLDIWLDVRDIDWDFGEPEISTSYHSDYKAPFSPSSMRTVMSLLLPHLSRWRSIDILTDTWAPMHTALTTLSAPLIKRGAPLLESLTLMRCNDYVSHSPEFQPQHLKHPFFLTPFGSSPCTSTPELPRLRKLILRGVHMNWLVLPAMLPIESPVLHTLELSSHSLDVRPTVSEFRDILASCRSLQTLIVNGSGLSFDEDDGLSLKLGAGASRFDKRLLPIALPHLRELTVGYRTALDGCRVLSTLEAPNVRALTLEDATNPSDVEEVNAAQLLRFVATCDVGDFAVDFREARSHPPSPNLNHSDTDEDDDDARSWSSRSKPSLPSQSLSSSCAHSHPRHAKSLPLSFFPHLEKVILKRVKAHTKDFQTFFLSLPNLKSLDIRGMSSPMVAVMALSSTFKLCPNSSAFAPSFTPASSTSPHPSDAETPWAPPCSVPCPQLQRLCIRGGLLRTEDLEYIVRDLVSNRTMGGAGGLEWLDVYLDHNSRDRFGVISSEGLFDIRSSSGYGSTSTFKFRSGCGLTSPSNPTTSSPSPPPPSSSPISYLTTGDLKSKSFEAEVDSGFTPASSPTRTIVRVYNPSPSPSETDNDGSFDLDTDTDADADSVIEHDSELEEAFRVGGVFNDPIFDAQYSYSYSTAGSALAH